MEEGKEMRWFEGKGNVAHPSLLPCPAWGLAGGGW